VQLLLQDWADTQAKLADTEVRMTAVLDELGLTTLATSIHGLSPVGAAAILAETGDPHRFATARAPVKHAGRGVGARREPFLPLVNGDLARVADTAAVRRLTQYLTGAGDGLGGRLVRNDGAARTVMVGAAPVGHGRCSSGVVRSVGHEDRACGHELDGDLVALRRPERRVDDRLTGRRAADVEGSGAEALG
jgi:Transposase IS116/IS110/IS902 family